MEKICLSTNYLFIKRNARGNNLINSFNNYQISFFSRKSNYSVEFGNTVFLLVDASECIIERPHFGQKLFYSGKKKTHTIKYQSK